MGRILAIFAALVAATTLNGCGGASGGTAGALGVIAQKASIALTLAAERSDSVQGVFVTYTKVSLVPAGGGEPVVLFESARGKEVNVSRLDEEALLFAVMDDVPTGTYTKLLVAVANVRVEGGPCEDLVTRIPDDELELVPDEDIEVNPGETIIIRLAMDADKSVQITVDGASETCTFRPVIDVDVTKSAASGADSCPTTVEGEVTELMLNVGFDVIGAVIDLGDTRGEQELLFDGDTAFFNAGGLPAESDVVAIGERLTAKGELDGDGVLKTRVVVVGGVAVVSGTVVSGVERGIFWIEPDEGSEIVGETPVELFHGTQVLLDCVEATAESILKGARVAISGKIAVGERSVRAVFVLVSPTVLVGELTEVADAAGGGWNIAMIPEGTRGFRKVFVPADVGFFLAGDGPIPADFLADLVDCAGRHVRVYLAEDKDADTATEVRVGAEDIRAGVEEVAPDKRLLVLGDALVLVRRGATILDLRHGQKPIDLAEIEPGDVVRAIGLDACDDEDVDFHAFVLLVLPEEDRPKPPEHEDEGCHYDKWKQHVDRWPARYGPRTMFADVFDDVFPDMTLFEVIDTKDGELNHLGRETVAALLNAASEEIDFVLTIDEVVRKFNSIDHRDVKGRVKQLRKAFHALMQGRCIFDGKHEYDGEHDSDGMREEESMGEDEKMGEEEEMREDEGMGEEEEMGEDERMGGDDGMHEGDHDG